MGWTDESVNKLRELWAQGLTANEIAKKLGVTKNAIVGKVHRLCLTARPSPIKPKESAVQTAPKLPLSASEVDVVESADEKSKTADKNENSNIKLVDLDSHTCRWPLGDPRDDDFSFCGKKVRSGQTYCDEHAMMAYVKATRK